MAELGKKCQGDQFIVNIYHRGTKFYTYFQIYQRDIHVKKKVVINSYMSIDPNDINVAQPLGILNVSELI